MGKGRFRNSAVKITPSKRGLILCEGETEENYFKGLISQEKYRRKFSSINVEIVKPKDHSPIGLVNEAKKRIKSAKADRNTYDFVWVIFDRDRHAKISDAFEIARNSNPEILIAFTIPCFEYYFLLHFERTSKAFSKCDNVISYLKSKKYLNDYEKSDNIFKLLEDRLTVALENGEWLLKQTDESQRIYELSSYSNIHILVKSLYDSI